MILAFNNFYLVVLLSLCFRTLQGQEFNNNVSFSANCEKKVTKNYAYEAGRFASDSVTSGPVLIIDKKYIFISNLKYSGKSYGVRFWAGTGEPSSDGVLVPDENNSTNPLKSYNGQNIYLQLPKNFTTDQIDYISIWSLESKTSLGHVMLNKNYKNIPDALGYHNKTKDNRPIYRVPFCCDVNEIYNGETKEKCNKVPADLPLNLIVFKSNKTFINTTAVLEDVEIAPYKYMLECSLKISLANDTSGFIYNSSLYVPIYTEAYSHGSFCIVYTTEQNVYTCETYKKTPPKNSLTYISFLIISIISLIVSALVYIFVLREKDVHRNCFLGYSVSMILAFMTLLGLHNNSDACNSLGQLFLLFLFGSFVWLACLCIDLIYVVKSYKNVPEDTSRIYLYLGLSLAAPLLIVGSSLMSTGIPDIPKSVIKGYSNVCSFEGVHSQSFLIPINLLMLVSVAALSYTCYIIRNKQNDSEDYLWMQNKSRFKFMLRSYFLVWITTLIWVMETLTYLTLMGSLIHDAINLIEASQGIFILIIFVLNKYVGKEIYNVINKKKNVVEQQQKYFDLLETLEKPNGRGEK